jgi:hypothetical protein
MKCLKCGIEMAVKNHDSSHDSRNGKQYERTLFWCEKDDIWMSLEVPKEG